MEDKRIPARALIECLLCGRCGKYATATGGGICEACTIRAELAAAKESAALLRATIDNGDKESEREHEELLKFLRSSLGKKDVHGPYDGVSQLVSRNGALKAHVERLREAATNLLPGITHALCYADENRLADPIMTEVFVKVGALRDIQRALAATPEQSLAKVKAETLLEAWRKVCAAAIVAEEKNSTTLTWSDVAVIINDEAERIEEESANG